ncbi:DUF349 domain-containing protein [Segniliparus rugosus]|uniref:DUF349 domain-containing protein n=1 Tax=Segniliparus rugosus (strain ATCC BAA-974 / DSM 45345 / CCUG 50838 / CIP 108380 / JCM 13579 / CDC 945) TaxID=679197 RepID=E5XMB6_SEGRC|nr:DUF349 domain-containing protein [Segniliparus rugosus]EFV14495.1 hypothetical protein HMPREF9336_00636 [Segniliparus rugosus ATCC BAA-974]
MNAEAPTQTAPKPSPAAVGRQPRPAPRPGAAPAPKTSGIHKSDPARYGRIDESGAVWLRTEDGERQIGVWEAGTPEEGLAHFGRRFEDLVTEAEILRTRLEKGGDARKTKTAAEELLRGLPEAAALGDFAALQEQLSALVARADEAQAGERERRAAHKQEAAAERERLAQEAEQIARSSTDWKAAGQRLRDILDQWKTIKGLDRDLDEALWARYKAAREQFNNRRQAHFAELDRSRAQVKQRKEELVARAEALAKTADPASAPSGFREIRAAWKKLGPASREDENQLWARLNAAQDAFSAAQEQQETEHLAEYEANAAAKEALLARLERTDPEEKLAEARSVLREVRDRWEKIGQVPKDRVKELSRRLQEASARIEEADRHSWTKSDPELKARAHQFVERAEQFEEQAAKAKAKGKLKEEQKLLEQAQQWRQWAEQAHSSVEG